MASSPDVVSMALFCDFENVALGVRDANYEKFDIKPVLERLLLKGSIVVKKAYCDWDRYKAFKATMHEANFELIEIPHLRQSGKNSADIRMVVDALDLCYTKSHVDTFVIISGDSDFSPLVSKLRENAKHVIGVGVKQSTSDLLIANCDEFIFYDDLVRAREAQRSATRRDSAPAQAKRSPEDEKKRKEEIEARKDKAIDLVVATLEDLRAERADGDKIWASVLKEAIKRRKPDFNEAYYGFRAFGNLLQEAQARGFLEFGRDEKSGAYVSRGRGIASTAELTPPGALAPAAEPPSAAALESAPAPAETLEAVVGKSNGRRRGGRGGRSAASGSSAQSPASAEAAVPDAGAPAETVPVLLAAAAQSRPERASARSAHGDSEKGEAAGKEAGKTVGKTVGREADREAGSEAGRETEQAAGKEARRSGTPDAALKRPAAARTGRSRPPAGKAAAAEKAPQVQPQPPLKSKSDSVPAAVEASPATSAAAPQTPARSAAPRRSPRKAKDTPDTA